MLWLLDHPLGRPIRNFLANFIIFSFWILLPTNSGKIGAGTHTGEDVWTVWRNFRTLCGNSPKLFVGLSFTQDLDDHFIASNDTIKLWLGEPVSVCPTTIFFTFSSPYCFISSLCCIWTFQCFCRAPPSQHL